jgi:hypothetical protein
MILAWVSNCAVYICPEQIRHNWVPMLTGLDGPKDLKYDYSKLRQAKTTKDDSRSQR